jgi:hypothetical protein
MTYPPPRAKTKKAVVKLLALSDSQHDGVFEVVFVNALMQTANIRLVDGTAHVLPNVPWTALSYPAKA